MEQKLSSAIKYKKKKKCNSQLRVSLSNKLFMPKTVQGMFIHIY